MATNDAREQATLLDVLIDGFEKNETFGGRHWRQIPMPDEPAAVHKFASLAEEARRWKGSPEREEEEAGRRIVAWSDLEIRQTGRGVLVTVRTPQFAWWSTPETWQDDPMGAVFEWFMAERGTPGNTTS